MCGICGFYIHAGTSKSSDLRAMAQTLTHRGPDDFGYHLESFPADSSGVCSTAGLAHRRLSIIDLSPQGRQPMLNEDRTIALVFNGEVYNFPALRGELETRGHKFISKTDSEVIVHGYEEWGLGVFKKLNGMFAIAIWDKSKREFILARDRVGIKPLYYYHKGNAFLFASELRAMQAHHLFEPEIDLLSLGRYLSFSYVPAPGTIFKNTYKVMPGELLIVRDGQVLRRRFWDLIDHMKANNAHSGLNETIKRCEELLFDAVKLRLISDVPLGAFLSGGYDSSLVVAMMKEAGLAEIKTFTIGFRESESNEAPYARAIARHLGTDHHELTLSASEAFDTLDRLSAVYDEPFGDHSAMPTYLVSKFTRDSGMTVALSGDGGDELFRGYVRYATTAKMRFLRGVPPPARNAISRVFSSLPHQGARKLAEGAAFDAIDRLYHYRISSWKEGRPEALVRYQDADIESGLCRWIYGNGCKPADSPFIEKLFQTTNFYKTFARIAELDPVWAMSMADIHTYMVDDILTKVDRASMAVSLEVRVPILDHRLVELASTLPTSFNKRNGGGKFILKEISKKYIPKRLLERPKHGFSIPVNPWLRGPLKAKLLQMLSPEKIKREGLFHADRVEHLLSGYLGGKYNCGRLMWSLLMFELWLARNPVVLTEGNIVERQDFESVHVDSELLSTCGWK